MKEKGSVKTDERNSQAYHMDRRGFLKAMGGGILISFLPIVPSQTPEALSAGPDRSGDLNAYLRIGEDGRVTCLTGKIEMGQGVMTSLAQMLAEELDVPLDSVDMVMGDTDLCPWDAGTYGSQTTKYFGPPLRAAAAEARAILVLLAAERLGVGREHLETRAGFVVDKRSPERRVSYGKLTRGKRIERRLGAQPFLKSRSEFTISGKPVPHKDALEKVTGRAQFAGDISLPGMLHARILRPPAHRAKLLDVDTSAAARVPGARVVKDGDLIAVLHPRPDQAEKALKLVRANFGPAESKLDHTNIFDHLMSVTPRGNVAAETGDVRHGRGLASRVIEGTYRQGYVAHAPLETHTATAAVTDGAATVWASTQTPFPAQREVASVLNLPLVKVRIITPFVGGGFGGKTRNRQVVEAARLAALTGKPVQVAWTRAEEFFYDTFQPAAVVKIASGLDGSNRIVFWDYHVHFAGDRGAASFYNVPHQRTTVYGSWYGAPGAHPFETGAWRGPGSNTNTFARESHIDVIAAAAGTDPLAFRLKHLKDKRMLRVLETAANAFGWSPSPAPSGKGRGMACGIYKGTYVAALGEAEVDNYSGACRIKRVVFVQDMGEVINPEGAKMQVEGCVMMGLGYALRETVHFRNGQILDRNFDTYEIPRFSWMPKTTVLLVDNPGIGPQEGGEPAITCMGALVANAVFDASGIRIRELPITPDRIREGLKSAKELSFVHQKGKSAV